MAKTRKSQQRPQKQKQRQNQPSTRPSGPSTLSAPLLNLASSAGRQSEIALPVRKGSQTFTVHPDNTRWLGEAAPSFQKWGMHDLTLWYVPRVSTSMNGQIALTFLSDFADLSPTSLEDTVTLAGAQHGAPWSRFQLPKQRNRLFDYCSLRDFAAGDATTMNSRSPGRIVCFADMDESFSDNDIVGWVYIGYTPVLQQPILRRLQVGGPSGDGGPVGAYSDYYYHINDYSNRSDFMGMNSELDPNRMIRLTHGLWYVYDTNHGMTMVTNVTTTPISFYAEVLLRDVNIIASNNTMKLSSALCHLYDGNKGKYESWANGDVLYRLAGQIEPNGWFSVDSNAGTKWGNSEVFMFELGSEIGPVVIPRQTLSLSDKKLVEDIVFPVPTPADSGSLIPSLPSGFTFVTNTTGTSEGVSVVDPRFPTLPGVDIVTGSAAMDVLRGGNKLLNPANVWLDAVFRNKLDKVVYLSISIIILNFWPMYGEGLSITTPNGIVADNICNRLHDTNNVMCLFNVALQPGSFAALSAAGASSGIRTLFGRMHFSVNASLKDFWVPAS